MSWGEGHGLIARVEAGIECSQEDDKEHGHEADIGHDWGTDTEPDPEAEIGPTLQIEYWHNLKIVINLIPKVNRPFPQTISGNLWIGGSASRCLKMRIQW